MTRIGILLLIWTRSQQRRHGSTPEPAQSTVVDTARICFGLSILPRPADTVGSQNLVRNEVLGVLRRQLVASYDFWFSRLMHLVTCTNTQRVWYVHKSRTNSQSWASCLVIGHRAWQDSSGLRHYFTSFTGIRDA